MPGALGSNQQRVDSPRRFDLAEMDVEPVRAHQHVSGRQVIANLVAINIGLDFIGKQYVDHVGHLGGVGDRHGLEAVGNGQIVIGRTGPLADHDIASAVFEVLSLGVSLRAVTENRDRLAFEVGKVRVVLVVNRGSH